MSNYRNINFILKPNSIHSTLGGHPPGKPGNAGEFDIGWGKVREIRKKSGKSL